MRKTVNKIMEKQMPLLYFTSTNDNGICSYRGEIWQEYQRYDINGFLEKAYKRLEEIYLSTSDDLSSFESVTFKIDFGKDSCMGHWAKSRLEFMKAMENDKFDNYTPVDRNQYEVFRKKILGLYNRLIHLNIDTVETLQDFSVRTVL